MNIVGKIIKMNKFYNFVKHFKKTIFSIDLMNKLMIVLYV